MRSWTRSIAQGLLVPLLFAPTARAELSGEHVVSGEASFDRSGDITTIHASDGAIINYTQFSVWANEELHFIQPSSDARVLNRVLGDATHIDGGLYANGIVYIVNPAGVFFGGTAIVDVGGLYAAAGNISNEDFLARQDAFSLTGMVENAGSIESPAVALVGAAVANHGSISAPKGTIALVAGEKVLLTQLGSHLAIEVEGAGGAGAGSLTTGDVYSLAINHTGITRGAEIDLIAASGTVAVSGTLDASDRSAGATGGSISVTGERVALLGAQLDASGDAGGGRIRVGGDLRGEGELPNARRTYVDETSTLVADAITRGSGGRVIVWADEANAFHGSLSARGGAAGGDGGFAEISSGGFMAADGDVDLGAASGATGTLLYDPTNIVITGGTGDSSFDPSVGEVLFTALPDTFAVFESELESTTANIVLQANNGITTTATNTFTNEVAGEGTGVLVIGDGHSLTMTTGSTSTAGIDLRSIAIDTSGADGTAAGEAGGVGGEVKLTAGGTGPVQTGAIDTSGGNGMGTGGTGGAAGAVTITTAGGDIEVASVTALGGTGTAAAAIDVGGGAGGAVTLSAGGTGSITAGAIDTTGGAGTTSVGGKGGAISLTTADGAIQLASATASGGSGSTPADPEPGNLAAGGGSGGAISLRANDADASGDSDITVTGDLVSRGGAASDGAGGVGGSVTVRSDGVAKSVVPTPPPVPSLTPVVGGGSLDVASIDTRGGAGDAKGGQGGVVALQTTDGAISADDVETSGGAGGTGGGNAGGINVSTRDADMQNDNDVALGNLRAVGGTGTSKTGGVGGAISVQTERSLRITEQGKPDNVLQEAIGGGDVSIASVDSHGGDGGSSGGSGGGVTVQARGDGNTLVIGAPILTSGGDGGSAAPDTGDTNNGGAGGSVTLLAQDSNLTVPAIDSRGGDAGTNAANNALGGSGGGVRITTGIEDEDQGNILISALIDAREGTSGAAATPIQLSARDSGPIVITSAEDIDQSVAGPAITTTGSVTLTAKDDIGQATGSFVVRGSDERRADSSVTGDFRDHDSLSVTAGGTADVSVASGGRFLNKLSATATTLDADIRITQPGSGSGDVVAMSGSGGQMVVTQVDSTDNDVDVAVRLDNPDDDSAADAALVIATGAVSAGRVFDARSDGDLIVGTTDGVVIDASAVEDLVPGGAPKPLDAVLLRADNDGDGTGALRDAPGAATGVIDLDAADPGGLVLFAAEAIGSTSDPITTTGGARLSAIVVPLKQDDNPDTPNGVVIDPDADAGIFVRNRTGDLSIVAATSSEFANVAGVRVALGRGDIEITNEDGDISVESQVTRPFGTELGTGGDMTLTVDPSSRIVLDTPPTTTLPGVGTFDSVSAGGTLTFAGNVAVAQNTAANAVGDVTFTGAIDADAGATSSSLNVTAGDTASFGGDVGAADPLTGLTVSADEIVFDEAGNQRVVTESGGIALDGGGSPTKIPSVATIGKTGGDLSLETTGALAIGDGDKLSSAGRLDIEAASVRVTDLSALDITVTSDDTQIFARAPGPVKLPSGQIVGDPGTDIVANTVSFSAAPTAVGSGTTPRIATESGIATNPGAFRVTPLANAVTSGQIAANGEVFDLALLVSDPGHETPELEGGPVVPPFEPYPSQDQAGPGAPVSREEVVAFLSCAPLGEEFAPSGCGPTAPPAYGSALDTDRAVEVARAYRELLGESERARAGREALANAATNTKAELGAAASPAGRAYLTEIARLLGQVRLLGLGARYPEVRSDLLTGIAGAIGAPGLDAARLGTAVDARAMGMPI